MSKGVSKRLELLLASANDFLVAATRVLEKIEEAEGLRRKKIEQVTDELRAMIATSVKIDAGPRPKPVSDMSEVFKK